MATSQASTARAAVDLTFEELYRELRADVYRAALRELGNAHDAEDVTQAAFADAYRAVLRGTRPESPRAWLLAISENVRNRRFRTAQRRPREEALDDADFPLAAELPYEQTRALTEALATLPTEQRRVFVLREIVGLSYDEIADEVDSTVASVQMLLFRARRQLRDVLDPPTVAVRRPVFLPPVPSWLAGLWTRFEVATLTPRAAGALGAAVLTVGGASVAVPVSQADGLRRAPAAAQAAAAPTPATPAAKSPAKPAARSLKARPVAATAVRTAPKPQPRTQPLQPVAAAPPAPQAVPETVAVPVAVPASPGQDPRVAPPSQAPSLDTVVAVVEEVVPLPVELPLPPVTLPVPLPVPPLPLPPLPPVLETVTGAAGAAGASAPPLPVPAVPLPTLPHAP